MASSAKKIAEELACEMGYELIDTELRREHGSVFLRILIEHEGGLDLALCEAYHRRLNPLVEHLDYDYLEVSSPGVDRPLKTARDFERGKGGQVTVKLYRALDGKKEYVGTLLGLEGEEVVLDTQDGTMRFPRKECALVKPAYAFDIEGEATP
jgi:ribosome maturation factor RimP